MAQGSIHRLNDAFAVPAKAQPDSVVYDFPEAPVRGHVVSRRETAVVVNRRDPSDGAPSEGELSTLELKARGHGEPEPVLGELHEDASLKRGQPDYVAATEERPAPPKITSVQAEIVGSVGPRVSTVMSKAASAPTVSTTAPQPEPAAPLESAPVAPQPQPVAPSPQPVEPPPRPTIVSVASPAMGRIQIPVATVSVSKSVVALGYVEDGCSSVYEPPIGGLESQLVIGLGDTEFKCAYFGFNFRTEIAGQTMLWVVLARVDE